MVNYVNSGHPGSVKVFFQVMKIHVILLPRWPPPEPTVSLAAVPEELGAGELTISGWMTGWKTLAMYVAALNSKMLMKEVDVE